MLIVGAGLAGLSVAWHLAQTRSGQRVLVLDQGPAPAGEASAQNAGMLRRFALDPLERARAQRTFEALRSLPTDDWPDPAFRSTGSVLGLATDRPDYAVVAEDLLERGVRVERIEGTDLGRVAPILEDSPIEACWWLPQDGVCDPWTLAQGFARGAGRRGVQFAFDQRVCALLVTGADQVHGVRLADGTTIHAETTVLCTAAWTPLLDSSADLRPLARHLWQSDAHPLSAPGHPWCWIDDVGVYARPEAGGFLCSPCDEELRIPHPGPDSIGRPEAEARAVLIDKLERFLPALGSVRFDRGWRGLRTFAADRTPRLGPDPERTGLFWATGLGGSGVSTCWAIGEEAAAVLAPAPDRERLSS